MVRENATIKGNLVVLDLRDQEEIYTGNRFILYSLFPEQNVSLQVLWGVQKQNIVMTCGYSIINKTATVDIGSLMLTYGGGGHKKVGTCQVPIDEAEKILEELIGELK
jgi:nanoRNase/pAp phosphatase (c-di-AMP/oligoRNAs hydrolase)